MVNGRAVFQKHKEVSDTISTAPLQWMGEVHYTQKYVRQNLTAMRKI